MTSATFPADTASPPVRRPETAELRPRSPLSAELRFISACLHWPSDAAACVRIRQAAAAPLDWDRVLQLVARHRVAGLVQHGLTEAGVRPPLPTAARLQLAARQTAFEELGMVGELSKLQRAFAAANLRVVILKGISAALQGYGRIGLRQNRDIDLLIEPWQIATAVPVLGRQGYDPVEPAHILYGSDLDQWMRTHKDLVFRHRESSIIVEVHWRLFDNQQFAQSLQSVKPIQLRLPNGSNVWALDPDAAFLYMAAHGAQHAWSRLKWLADFAAYVRSLGEAHTAELYTLSKAERLGGSVAQGLLLAHELIGTPLPQELQRDVMLSWRLRLLHRVGRRALGAEEAVELEDRPFGSTLKTLSHYLLNGHFGYLFSQAVLDVAEVPKSHTSPVARRLGPLAKIPLWVYLRLSRAIRRGVHRPNS